MRKVNTEPPGGLQLSSNIDADNLVIARDAFAAAHRGAGVRWTVNDRRTAFRVEADPTPYCQPFTLDVANDELRWSEDVLLDLRGERLGIGYQWYTPNIEERGAISIPRPFRGERSGPGAIGARFRVDGQLLRPHRPVL
ncbi:MAG: hypothetical protein ACRDTK_05900 [Mycobacterium sp.]